MVMAMFAPPGALLNMTHHYLDFSVNVRQENLVKTSILKEFANFTENK